MGLTAIEECTPMKDFTLGMKLAENMGITEHPVTGFCIQINGFLVKMELTIMEKMQKDVRDCRP